MPRSRDDERDRNRSPSRRGDNESRDDRDRRHSRDYRRDSRYEDREKRHRENSDYRPSDRKPKKQRFQAETEPEASKQRWGKKDESSSDSEKEMPDFGTSGILNQAAQVRGVDLVYTECEDGGKPSTKWRLYPIKENETLEPIHVYRKSYYLLGRDRKVVDIPLDHPSCSKQHAVLQFRTIAVMDEETGFSRKVNRPYIIDLGSTNGVLLNGSKLDTHRYVELIEKDVLKFGNSSREFVLLHEGSKSD